VRGNWLVEESEIAMLFTSLTTDHKRADAGTLPGHRESRLFWRSLDVLAAPSCQ